MKGICKRTSLFKGIVTVSEKGQLSIPMELRRDLKIQKGDRLIMLKRKDSSGFNCLKENVIQKTLEKLSKD
jgi:AbrB family looped-hinge helix DNA binding protein